MESSDLARLPAELLAEVVSIAAWEVAQVDKAWLAGIAATSRLTLHTVKPILYHTVLLTDQNFDGIVACASSGNFSMTRCLWISKAPGAPGLSAIASAFACIGHLSASSVMYAMLLEADAAFRPRMLTLRSHPARADWHFVRAASLSAGLTHLHAAVEAYGPMTAALGDDSALRSVVLESAEPAWNAPRLVGTVLPFLLSCATLERVIICAAPDAASAQDANRVLAEYAAAHGERRMWMLDAPTDGRALPLFRPDVTFDPRKWTRGRQLVPAHK